MSKKDILNQYSLPDIDLNSVKVVNSSEEESQKEYDRFKERLSKLREPMSFDAVKELAKSMFDIKNEITYFKVGDGRCAIVNSGKSLKIILDSKKEQICYCFTAREQKDSDKNNG